ncbi:Cationic amino acid transporter 1 [Podosphaera aphanis]|nr:Cationic amino acid transporter 1 [Podosphaera aphanis]
MDAQKTKSNCFSHSNSTGSPLLTKTTMYSSPSMKFFDSFYRGSGRKLMPASRDDRRMFNAEAAAWNTANTPLVRRLKGRHIQMIAIGGSIGSGFYIGSGVALATAGPASLLIAYLLVTAGLFCVVQALGEMAVTFPVAGSFSAFATRFIDPAWGFAFGWNYALKWAFTFPLEIISAAIALEYWDAPIPGWIAITFFLVVIVSINLFSVKVYGEVEYTMSIVKVAAVIAYIILGAVINCGGTQDSGYIGSRYWKTPGAFHNGFKGFCDILVIVTFSFSGIELVALAAAETQNPSKTLPTSIKQVFWRIAFLYIVSVIIIGLLVPYDSPQLISRTYVDSKASPFIIAIQSAGIKGLDSVMNAAVISTVLSVANSSMYAATRTLTALAEQGQAPRFMAYVDRKGCPVVNIGIVSLFGLLSFFAVTPVRNHVFSWLLAISGLSTIFAWGSICYSHISFRRAWAHQGFQLSDLIYRSPMGTTGSYIGLIALLLILVAQFWLSILPAGNNTMQRPGEKATRFFGACLAVPMMLCFYISYKWWYRTRCVTSSEVDLDTGRNGWESEIQRRACLEEENAWPKWKIVCRTLC